MMSGSPERYCSKCGCRCHCYAPECPNCANDVCTSCECGDHYIHNYDVDSSKRDDGF